MDKIALVIFEQVDEGVKLLTISIADKSVEDKLRRFHNAYMNAVGTPAELEKEMDDFFYNENGLFKHDALNIDQPLVDFHAAMVVICGLLP